MSFELIAILVVGAAMGIGQAAAILIAVSGFGALRREMNRSFEAMNHSFEELTRELNHRFEELTREMNHRFEELTREMNHRFEELTREMNDRFDVMLRNHRAIAGLVVQESEKIQALLRP